ncbi:hypothetical protein [Dongshaea marina]|uniref:hypothetical protein n=1 Tax=Dongshaea marina TaxID=2047966 RepID=UPI000D3EDDFD|nr:hypothetical protein [Dongshaea marina]
MTDDVSNDEQKIIDELKPIEWHGALIALNKYGELFLPSGHEKKHWDYLKGNIPQTDNLRLQQDTDFFYRHGPEVYRRMTFFAEESAIDCTSKGKSEPEVQTMIAIERVLARLLEYDFVSRERAKVVSTIGVDKVTLTEKGLETSLILIAHRNTEKQIAISANHFSKTRAIAYLGFALSLSLEVLKIWDWIKPSIHPTSTVTTYSKLQLDPDSVMKPQAPSIAKLKLTKEASSHTHNSDKSKIG